MTEATMLQVDCHMVFSSPAARADWVRNSWAMVERRTRLAMLAAAVLSAMVEVGARVAGCQWREAEDEVTAGGRKRGSVPMQLGVCGLDGLDQVSHILWSGQDPVNLCDQPKGTTCRSVLEDDWITLLPTAPPQSGPRSNEKYLWLPRTGWRGPNGEEAGGHGQEAPTVRKQAVLGRAWLEEDDGRSDLMPENGG